jgi:hypothetical protein
MAEHMATVMKRVIGLNLILGVWLFVSPFAFGDDTVSTAATWNDVVVGLVIIGCAWCSVAGIPGQTVCSACGILCGAWLVLAPFILNYRVEAFGMIIGALVLVVSIIEGWQLTHSPSHAA